MTHPLKKPASPPPKKPASPPPNNYDFFRFLVGCGTAKPLLLIGTPFTKLCDLLDQYNLVTLSNEELEPTLNQLAFAKNQLGRQIGLGEELVNGGQENTIGVGSPNPSQVQALTRTYTTPLGTVRAVDLISGQLIVNLLQSAEISLFVVEGDLDALFTLDRDQMKHLCPSARRAFLAATKQAKIVLKNIELYLRDRIEKLRSSPLKFPPGHLPYPGRLSTPTPPSTKSALDPPILSVGLLASATSSYRPLQPISPINPFSGPSGLAPPPNRSVDSAPLPSPFSPSDSPSTLQAPSSSRPPGFQGTLPPGFQGTLSSPRATRRSARLYSFLQRAAEDPKTNFSREYTNSDLHLLGELQHLERRHTLISNS